MIKSKRRIFGYELVDDKKSFLRYGKVLDRALTGDFVVEATKEGIKIFNPKTNEFQIFDCLNFQEFGFSAIGSVGRCLFNKETGEVLKYKGNRHLSITEHADLFQSESGDLYCFEKRKLSKLPFNNNDIKYPKIDSKIIFYNKRGSLSNAGKYLNFYPIMKTFAIQLSSVVKSENVKFGYPYYCGERDMRGYISDFIPLESQYDKVIFTIQDDEQTKVMRFREIEVSNGEYEEAKIYALRPIYVGEKDEKVKLIAKDFNNNRPSIYAISAFNKEKNKTSFILLDDFFEKFFETEFEGEILDYHLDSMIEKYKIENYEKVVEKRSAEFFINLINESERNGTVNTRIRELDDGEFINIKDEDLNQPQ